MNIVLEGPDGSGKSTLAHIIAQHVPALTYTPGRGPEQYPGEIVERARAYMRLDLCLFDRHPIISQPIYGAFRPGATMIPQDLIDEFYATQPLLIYCHGRAGTHEVKDYDTADHVAMIHRFDDNIRNAYEEWAAGRANVRYQVGDEVQPIIKLCQEFCNAQ